MCIKKQKTTAKEMFDEQMVSRYFHKKKSTYVTAYYIVHSLPETNAHIKKD